MLSKEGEEASHWSRRVLAACGEELNPVGGLGRPTGNKEGRKIA